MMALSFTIVSLALGEEAGYYPELAGFQSEQVVIPPQLSVQKRDRLLSMLIDGRENLLEYIKRRNFAKRQRQCYWSVVSCF
ncbi:hypothetical protein ScPMuIL_007458 [Solemya velum]